MFITLRKNTSNEPIINFYSITSTYYRQICNKKSI